jgi:hypothetical protein
MGDERDFDSLTGFLRRVPAIDESIEKGRLENGNWWVQFTIDIDHPLAWNVVQELGCVLNYLSVEERLPMVFKPVSPAPYLNGGPREYLSWLIESSDPELKPGTCKKWLEGRLPQPVDDESAWPADDEEDDDDS